MHGDFVRLDELFFFAVLAFITIYIYMYIISWLLFIIRRVELQVIKSLLKKFLIEVVLEFKILGIFMTNLVFIKLILNLH